MGSGISIRHAEYVLPSNLSGIWSIMHFRDPAILR